MREITITVNGPPMSGKSDLIKRIEAAVLEMPPEERRENRLITIREVVDDISMPYTKSFRT